MLEAARKPNKLITRDSDAEFDGAPVQHAVDESGLPLLVIPSTQEPTGLLSLVGLAISATSSGVPQKVYLRCLDQRLATQFSYFADDLLESIRRSPAPDWNTCLGVIENWRELFRSPTSDLLGLEGQIGLLAELRLLEAAVNLDRGAWATWFGYDKSRHDFRGSQRSVEVKSTMRHHVFAVTVHGFGQLEPPSGAELLVYAERVERSPGPSAESLFSVATRLIALSTDRAAFSSSLKAAGLDPARLAAYEPFTFGLLEQKLMRVDDEFPRITPASVGTSFAALIPEIQYVVNIGAVPSLAVSGSALDLAAELLVATIA
jgi:hypothetical protein